jgi:hypothetical protein
MGIRSAADSERWEWYAAGDRTVAPPIRSPLAHCNTPAHAAWEIGWVFAVPLTLAVIAALAFPS